jgi:hypothetical protein
VRYPNAKGILTYLFPMLQSPTHRLEVHTTELAHDVRRVALRSPVGSAFDPGSHSLDFVLDQGFPVFAVDVAFLAVEVSGIVTLVSLHVLFVVEGLEATLDVARHILDGLERHRHLAGVKHDSVMVGVLEGEWNSLIMCCVFLLSA